MQIESFKIFSDLVETESFTKTAQINNVTQSAVSQQISSLERQFKSLLVERSKKNFRLTREGEVLYRYSREILQTYDLMQSKVQEIKAIVAGTIRIATIYSIGLHALPPYIKKLLKSHPAVNVHVEYRRANEVQDEVLSNGVDLGLLAYPQKSAKLEMVPLWKEKLVLICSPQNPLAAKRAVKWPELAGQKFVAFEPDIPTRRAIDALLRQRGVGVRIVMEFDNIETVKRAVEIDAGISIVPEGTIIQELADKSLAAVELDSGKYFRPAGAIFKSKKVLSPAMTEFLKILKQ